MARSSQLHNQQSTYSLITYVYIYRFIPITHSFTQNHLHLKNCFPLILLSLLELSSDDIYHLYWYFLFCLSNLFWQSRNVLSFLHIDRIFICWSSSYSIYCYDHHRFVFSCLLLWPFCKRVFSLRLLLHTKGVHTKLYYSNFTVWLIFHSFSLY